MKETIIITYSKEQLEDLLNEWKCYIEYKFTVAITDKRSIYTTPCSKTQLVKCLERVNMQEIRCSLFDEDNREYQYHFERYKNFLDKERELKRLESAYERTAKNLELEIYKYCAFSEQLKENLQPKCFELIKKTLKEYLQYIKNSRKLINKKAQDSIDYLKKNGYL